MILTTYEPSWDDPQLTISTEEISGSLAARGFRASRKRRCWSWLVKNSIRDKLQIYLEDFPPNTSEIMAMVLFSVDMKKRIDMCNVKSISVLTADNSDVLTVCSGETQGFQKLFHVQKLRNIEKCNFRHFTSERIVIEEDSFERNMHKELMSRNWGTGYLGCQWKLVTS